MMSDHAVSAAVAKPGELGESCLERARAVAPVLAAAAAEIEAERELPPEVLAAMHEGELFRLSLPASLGGAELAPARLAQVAEIIAMADASAAWCLGQAFGCAMSAAFLDDGPAAQVFGPRDAVLAWGAGFGGKAVAADGGFHVTGNWRFASGGKHATWIGAHCTVLESDGSPRLDAKGRPVHRTALFRRDQVSIADDWYVMGLKGTRSEGYSVDGLFVEQGLTLDRGSRHECRNPAALYLFPTTNVYAAVFSGVALGIARGALADLLVLARAKTARGARSSLRESPVFQARLAELEAQLASARAYHQQVLNEVWERVTSTGELLVADRAQIRLVTTYAINQATEVVEQVYRLAGSTAIFEDQPFERRFRDIHAVSQQIQGRHSNFETVGRFMLGLGADTMFM